MDLSARWRQVGSPAILTRTTRQRGAGNRVDLSAAASARAPSPQTSPATPTRTTRRRDAGRVELPRQAGAVHPSAREPVPLAANEASSKPRISLRHCAAQWVLRTRGGGRPGDAGVPSEHKSALDRQSPLSPAPLAHASQEVRGSSNATSPSLPHTLEPRECTGTEEERSEAASRPALEGAADCAPLTAPDCVTADRLPLAPLPVAGAGLLHDLAAAQVVTLAELSAAGVVLLFVANFARPLVYAHVNGFEVLGAELPVPTARATPMRLLEKWAELAFSASALRLSPPPS